MRRERGGWTRRLWLAVGLGALALAATAPVAAADFGFVPGSFAAASSSTQAGAHGDITTSFVLNSHPDPSFSGTKNVSDGDAKDIVVHIPPGLVGNVQAYPKCSYDDLEQNACPLDSQIGFARVGLEPFPPPNELTQAVFNMVPAPGHVAEFGMKPFSLAQVHIVLSVRTGGDYGITATVPDIASNLSLLDSTLTIWGVPADSSHDAQRCQLFPNFSTTCLTPSPSGNAHVPLLSNPTRCDTADPTTLTADSWQNPGLFLPLESSAPQQMTGCDLLSFKPSMTLQPQDRRPGVPSSYTVDLHVSQNDFPNGLATAALKQAVVTLPEGVRVSPSAADGLQGCSDAQIGLDNANDPACPDGSKIGSVEIKTALLPAPLDGAVYQGTQTPGHLLRIFIVAQGFGVTVKLPGSIDLDPSTGQITTTVDNAPQIPFDDFVLTFKGGARAPLSNPTSCGPKTTSALLTSYSGQSVLSTDGFTVSQDGNGAPCAARGFDPSFTAGTENPVAGADSSLITQFSRDDQDQELSGIDVTMPTGVLGRVANVTLCPDAAATAGTCTDISKIGSATVAAGPGSHPFYISDGRVYLTGPYKGAPFGLSIVVHAAAGPLDLGNVIVRAQLQVDPATTQLRVVTDPLPTILMGIPLQLRLANVTIDRPNFTFNPTSCAPKSASAQITSTEGAAANRSVRFQVGDCAALPFSPRIALRIGDKRHTRAGDTTPFRTTITMAKGQANLSTVAVTLPTTLNARLPAASNACSQADFLVDHCSSKAKVGSAVIFTPVLRDPLRGSAYFVKNPKRPLPDLSIALRGQVNINLTGHVSIVGSKALATRFSGVPDAPFTKFRLDLVAGGNGPLGAVINLCSAKARKATASIGIRAQNNKLVNMHQRLQIIGCKKGRAKK